MLSFRPLIPVANYLINYDYYVKACVNKDKPKLHCNGKCRLAKDMAENSGESTDTKTVSVPSIDVFVLHDAVDFSQKKTTLTQIIQKKFFTKQILYSFTFHSIHLKPPIAFGAYSF
jgi:hypothetical protein